MNSKNTLTLLLSIVTLLLLTFILYFLNENVKINNDNTRLYKQVTKFEIKEKSFDLNKKMTGRKISDVVCVTRNDDEKFLSELTNGLPILIYRYTQGGCLPCYEEQIRLIQEIFKDIPQQVVILSSYFDRFSFLFSMRDRDLDVSIFRIPFDTFDRQFEGLGIPYFFVLHPCLRISNIFVPNEHEPELTRRYLESIKRLLQ